MAAPKEPSLDDLTDFERQQAKQHMISWMLWGFRCVLR